MVFCPACQQVRIVNYLEILAMMWGLSLMDFVFFVLYCFVLYCFCFTCICFECELCVVGECSLYFAMVPPPFDLHVYIFVLH